MALPNRISTPNCGVINDRQCVGPVGLPTSPTSVLPHLLNHERSRPRLQHQLHRRPQHQPHHRSLPRAQPRDETLDILRIHRPNNPVLSRTERRRAWRMAQRQKEKDARLARKIWIEQHSLPQRNIMVPKDVTQGTGNDGTDEGVGPHQTNKCSSTKRKDTIREKVGLAVSTRTEISQDTGTCPSPIGQNLLCKSGGQHLGESDNIDGDGAGQTKSLSRERYDATLHKSARNEELQNDSPQYSFHMKQLSDELIDVDPSSSRSTNLSPSMCGSFPNYPGTLESDENEPLSHGSRSDKYINWNYHAEGTSTIVYEATDEKTGQTVAIQQLLEKQTQPMEQYYYRRYINEEQPPLEEKCDAEIMKRAEKIRYLSHENVVKLIGVCNLPCDESTWTTSIIMDLCATSLEVVIAPTYTELTLGGIRSVAYQVLQGVHYLHSNDIHHRNLRPSNILLKANGRLKIGGFGNACVFQPPYQVNTEWHPSPHILTNNPPTNHLWYQAPEVILGSKQQTSSVDMWSVGRILVELIVGNKSAAMKGHTEKEQLASIQQFRGMAIVETGGVAWCTTASIV